MWSSVVILLIFHFSSASTVAHSSRPRRSSARGLPWTDALHVLSSHPRALGTEARTHPHSRRRSPDQAWSDTSLRAPSSQSSWSRIGSACRRSGMVDRRTRLLCETWGNPRSYSCGVASGGWHQPGRRWCDGLDPPEGSGPNTIAHPLRGAPTRTRCPAVEPQTHQPLGLLDDVEIVDRFIRREVRDREDLLRLHLNEVSPYLCKNRIDLAQNDVSSRIPQ